MTEKTFLRDRSYAARWAGGYIDEKPFVSLQIADAKVGSDGQPIVDGQPIAAPSGEIRELLFTEPAVLMGFINRALEVAEKMFPGGLVVDRSRSRGEPH